MQLIYCYIGKFRNIIDQEVIFNHDYDVSFIKHKLKIKKKEPDGNNEYLYGNSLVKNLSVVVGRTGSGKTNLLQLIGMDDYERSETMETDSYFLLYQKDIPTHFTIEYVGMNIEGITDISASEKKYGLAEFSTNVQTGEIEEIESIIKFSSAVCIVNSFDRSSFAYCPYDDIRNERIENPYGLIPRIIAPFGRFSVTMECILLKNYINGFPKESIKHTAAFEITCDNWKYVLNTEFDERLYEKYYWTYDDFIRNQKAKNLKKGVPYNTPVTYPKGTTPKTRFIHDLMVDYAIYLRKWVEGIRTHDADLSVDHGEKSILERIEELCQFIDMYSDEYATKYGLVWQISSDIKDIHDLLMRMDEKYFSGDSFSIPIDDIDLSDGSIMQNLFERMEQYRPDEYGIFTKELLPFHWTHISSGEYQYAKVWGVIEEFGIHMKIMSQGEKYRDAKMPDIILLLDEPEAYMHPEMCRQFVHTLSQIVNRRPNNASFQLIVTTHSPFILSDLLSNQIIKMDFDNLGLCKIDSNVEKSYFAANIHTIMADGFFLNYTIGEQARIFLQSKFDLLKGWAKKKDELTDVEKAEVEMMKNFVPEIGDEMIRYSFENLLKSMS